MVSEQAPPRGETTDAVAADELWRFSCDVFEDEAIARACLALQDDIGGDVNIILFVTWLVVGGWGPLDDIFLHAVIKAARPWQKDVVLPLRTLRRELKMMPVPEARQIRASVQQSEIAAERAEQTALVQVMAILTQDGDAPTVTTLWAELRRVLENYLNMIVGNDPRSAATMLALLEDYATAAERVLHKRSV